MKRHNGRMLAAMLVGIFALAGCGPMAGGNGGNGGNNGGTDGGMTGGMATTFQVTVKDVSVVYPLLKSGVFDTPDGASSPGPVKPGHSYSFSFTAAKGDKLFFATMFVQSNDLFYAPGPMGIPLYDMQGNPISGDVTSQVMLWDAGTEMNQEPGLGSNQPPRQVAANTGPADPNPNVRLADNAFGTLPPVSSVIKVTVMPGDAGKFTVTIADVAMPDTLTTSQGTHPPLPIAPGVYAVGPGKDVLFTPGMPAPAMGLEALAEDGHAHPLGENLLTETGVTIPISPGVFATTSMGDPLFTPGQKDMGKGLKELAEDGHPMMLAKSLAAMKGLEDSGAFTTPVGAMSPGPAGPGHMYQFTVQAKPGDMLYLATMDVQSNDAFYAPGAKGIALFDAKGKAMSGNVTSQLMLWDAGTEVNQEPGVGPDQAPRQSAPGAGMSESQPIEPMSQVMDGFGYPGPGQVLQVSVMPMAMQ